MQRWNFMILVVIFIDESLNLIKTDAERLKLGQQTRLDTLVVQAINNINLIRI